MASSFSVLSLKRNRSTSSSKGSKINTILNKLASPFHHDSKKRKQQFSSSSSQETRKSNSFGLLFIDYFRSEENSLKNNNHPFANDTLFEHNRYTTTKKQNNNGALPLKYDSKINIVDEQPKKTIITTNSNISSISNRSGILVKQPPISFINNSNQKNHRHTNSTLSVQSSKSAYHHRKGKKSSHIRHYSHVSCMSTSNITVNSENLTAKEFADIAGIRILSEDEENSSSTFQTFNGSSSEEKKIIKRCAFCDEVDDDSAPVHSSMIVTSQYNDDMDYEEDETEDNYTSYSSPLDTIQDADHDLNIWDVNFWQQPGDELQQVSSPHLHQNEEPPILHQLRRSNYSLSSNQEDTIIKKGRFEIHLSNCNNNNNTTSIDNHSEKAVPAITRPNVMEWKRKKRPTTLKHQITA